MQKLLEHQHISTCLIWPIPNATVIMDIPLFFVLLDLSAAFDTVNPAQQTSDRYWCRQNCVKMVWSLSDWKNQWTTRICIDGTFSKSHSLNYGVPQGSLVGPSCLIIYSSQIGLHQQMSPAILSCICWWYSTVY